VKKNLLKLLVSTLLTIAFLLLMDPRSFYGLVFHEWAGLIICIFFVLHITFDWKWVKTFTVRFFRKMPGRVRLNYVLDVFLLIGMTAVVVSGLPIARIIDFSWLGFERGNATFWRTLHTSSSMIVLVAMAVHLGLHWKWVTARFARRG
jgi:hypothetical protein